MRLHFRLSPNTQPVSFNHFHALTGRFHRWLGNNEQHDGMSLYSLSGLQGQSIVRNNALHFPRGATWFISAPDTEAGTALLNTVANAALAHPEMAYGIEVVEIYSEGTPEFGSQRIFRANSPIFIRGTEDDKHILYDNPDADEYLTRTLRNKLTKAGLAHLSESATVAFDRTYKSPKTRLIHVKEDFYKKASVCPVIVSGEPEAVRFAWNVGAGNLTGSGFGSLV